MPLPNPDMDFSAFDVLPADSLDDIVENVEALADGSGLNTNAVAASKLATSAITLGLTTKTSNFTTNSTSQVAVTGMSVTVTIPSGGRGVWIEAYCPYTYSDGASIWQLILWDGTVGSGTQLQNAYYSNGGTANITVPGIVRAFVTPSAGSKTYNLGAQINSGNLVMNSSNTQPMYLSVLAI